MSKWYMKYIVDIESDSGFRGPYYFSMDWAVLDKQAELIFGEDRGDYWREYLKKGAFNKSYEPPENHIHLARAVINTLKSEAEESKKKMIEARKELSALKRKK